MDPLWKSALIAVTCVFLTAIGALYRGQPLAKPVSFYAIMQLYFLPYFLSSAALGPIQERYLLIHVASQLTLLIGIVAGRVLFPPNPTVASHPVRPSVAVHPWAGVLAGGAALAAYLWMYVKGAGSLWVHHLQRLEVESHTVALVNYGLIAFIVLAFYLRSSRKRSGLGFALMRSTAIAALVIFVASKLFSGDRNALLAVGFPLLGVFVIRRRLSIRIAGVVILLGLLAIGGRVIEVIRMDPRHPLEALAGARDYLLRWDAGEFAAPVNAYTVLHESPWLLEPVAPGSTYFIEPLVTLIPRAVFPERPHTVAERMSIAYYSGAPMILGLGFSPILEAELNFGILGPPVVFMMIGLFLAWLERWRSRSELATFLGTFAEPVFFNFNRIDMAITLKMAMMLVVPAYLLYVLLTRTPSRGMSCHRFPSLGPSLSARAG